jgi:hypothetical protein
MPAVGQLGPVADRLGSLCGLTERHFAAIGHSLEQAVSILAALTQTFQALLGDLRGAELAQSRQDLASVATRVRAFAGTAEADVATLHQLAGIAEAIDGRVGHMRSVLREVDILAMNARLVAAGMGEAGIGFLPFAAEIRRSAGAGRDGLDQLARELAGARQHLQAAGQAAEAFEAQHAGTMQAITARLAAGVASIAAQVTLSGNAAEIVSARSNEINGQVGAAIMALQLGDITRQRIEHMHSACELLSHAAVPGSLGCRLVAAQLLDTAEDLDRGAALIVGRLHELAADAGEIARQGDKASGAADPEQGSFLDELGADTQQAQTLFGALRAAHATVNPRIAAVSKAADGLVGHVATIRSVEADIHIMGINASLKCDRLGAVGRPLTVISQAVRDCGGQTAQHAAAVLRALRHLRADAGVLAAADAAGGVDAINAASECLTGAARRVGDTGERMKQALARLAGDGAAVVRLLHAADEGFAVRHEIGAVLREAAATCLVQAGEAAAGDVTEPSVLARIAASYTMASERVVHARFVPLPATSSSAAAPAAAPATTEAELADMLF